MTCTCKECGRKYTYDDEVGYSKDLCGPYCDGRHMRTAEISRLRALLGEAMKLLQVVSDAAFVFDCVDTKDDCDLLAARIAKELEVPR